jgi:hypothetical protein
MARFETDDTAYLLWQSEMAPWGEYVVAVYKGSHSACDGSPDLSFVTQGVSSGQSSAKLWNFQLDSGTHNHSWRVRPVVVGLNWNNQFWDPCAHPRWSGCNRFVVEEKAPVLTKPVVYGPEEWWYGYLLAYWVKVPGADSYRIEVRIGSPSGPEFTTEEWTVSMLAANKAAWDQLVFQLGWPLPTDPSLWIAQIGGVPVGEYFWKVQACKLGTCGPPSDWVKWTELINPFP